MNWFTQLEWYSHAIWFTLSIWCSLNSMVHSQIVVLSDSTGSLFLFDTVDRFGSLGSHGSGDAIDYRGLLYFDGALSTSGSLKLLGATSLELVHFPTDGTFTPIGSLNSDGTFVGQWFTRCLWCAQVVWFTS